MIKHKLGEYPALFFPIYRTLAPKKNKSLLVDNKTELVIEGFPRSGNTFAVVAFQSGGSNRFVHIAHHLHVEAQVLRGVAKSLPVCVLIRNPIDAVKSLVVRHSDVTIMPAFSRYITFYLNIMPVVKKCHVVLFDKLVNNYGAVIEGINKKYGTNYEPFIHSKENIDKVFANIEHINYAIDNGAETHVARPSERRSAMIQKVKIDESSPLVVKAKKLFEEYSLLNSC